tara:strand:- start:8045 stop:8908 length:864 start_codon:yes stop_codon:yes gene_type:complete
MRHNKIIAGTMTWGKWGKNLSQVDMTNRIEQWVESGVSAFDHADIYGDYTTEIEFGKALKKSSIKAEELELITKCGIQMTTGRNNKVKHYDYRSSYIISSLEQSLKNLQVECIDTFLLHRPSPLMSAEEIAIAIEQLKQQGKIKSFGVSNFLPYQIQLLERYIDVEANQIQFSVDHLEHMYNGVLDDCQLNGRDAMAWSPLGAYFREDESEKMKKIRETIRELAAVYGTEEEVLVVAFILKHPAAVRPVVGTTDLNRLSILKKALSFEWPDEDWFVILESSVGRRVP